MKKQNYQLRIVIAQGKEVLAEVKMRRDTLEDLPNVPSLPGTIYNMIGDLCRLMVWSCRCRNDLILTWNKKLRKYTNGGK